jgi:hypothetical protein
MTEIKTITKISLLAYGIACLMYGILGTFFVDMFEAMTGYTDPLYPRMFAGILLVIAFYTFLILFKKGWDWEHIKFGFMILYTMILSTIIMEGAVTVLTLSSMSAEAVNLHTFNLILMPVLLILGIYSYMKQGA